MALSGEAAVLAARINKALGGEVIVSASDIYQPPPFPTGSLTLDVALGGGWAANQWAEVRGEQSNGKTAITLKTIAANQEVNPNFLTLWIAAEKYDTDQAAALGVDNERVVVAETRDMEVVYDTVIQFARERAVDCIVIDSYPALIAPEEEEKGMDQVQVALGARLTGKFFRMIGPAFARDPKEPNDRPILGLFINQFRDQIGGYSPMGTPKTTPGGKAKNYSFYQQVDVKRDEWIEDKVPGKDMKVKVGQSIKVRTVKNKQAPPQQVASVDFYFRGCVNEGTHKHGDAKSPDVPAFHRGEYDTAKEVITLGLVYDLIVRKGAYFEYDAQRWQGRDSMLQAFREQPDLLAALDSDVRQVALQGGRDITEEVLSGAETAGKRTVKRGDAVTVTTS